MVHSPSVGYKTVFLRRLLGTDVFCSTPRRPDVGQRWLRPVYECRYHRHSSRNSYRLKPRAHCNGRSLFCHSVLTADLGSEPFATRLACNSPPRAFTSSQRPPFGTASLDPTLPSNIPRACLVSVYRAYTVPDEQNVPRTFLFSQTSSPFYIREYCQRRSVSYVR